MVYLYSFENTSLTYLLIMDVFPHLELPTTITFIARFLLRRDAGAFFDCFDFDADLFLVDDVLLFVVNVDFFSSFTFGGCPCFVFLSSSSVTAPAAAAGGGTCFTSVLVVAVVFCASILLSSSILARICSRVSGTGAPVGSSFTPLVAAAVAAAGSTAAVAGSLCFCFCFWFTVLDGSSAEVVVVVVAAVVLAKGVASTLLLVLLLPPWCFSFC
mmetsp:Transcript_8018/g.15751  ORF Transcript_8018/g.15751 Transcript_8018/m.15751 type:complete len:214 (+) Transcript_8018:841-1482(+)